MPIDVLDRKTPEIGIEEMLVTHPQAEAMQAHLDMPISVSIPDLEQIRPDAEEKYGLSLSAMRKVGRIALSGAENIEESPEAMQLRGEFESSVFEGLSTDEELGKRLQVTKFGEQKVVDGQVVADNGTPMVQLVKNGYEAAKSETQKDPRMETQAQRDKNDMGVIEKINSMVAGNEEFNTFIVISSDPKEAIERDGAAYWYKRGYVKDMVYAQMYHWSGDELTTGALSFHSQDLGKLRDALVERGVEVPEDVAADDLINYSFSFDAANVQEAKGKALAMREECSDLPISDNTDTVDMVEGQQSMDMAFKEMYLPISESLAHRQKTERVEQVVATFKANSQYFDEEVTEHLERMQNAEYFSDEDARLLHQLSVYAAIEKVRVGLEGAASTIENDPYFSGGTRLTEGLDEYAVAGFLANMGNYVQLGSSMGRSYSSCGGALQLSAKVKEFDYGYGMNIPQDIFARYAQEAEREAEEDEHGPLNFKCTAGHPNSRKPGEIKLKCATQPCGGKVAC